jgi:hypothetical protein
MSLNTHLVHTHLPRREEEPSPITQGSQRDNLPLQYPTCRAKVTLPILSVPSRPMIEEERSSPTRFQPRR